MGKARKWAVQLTDIQTVPCEKHDIQTQITHLRQECHNSKLGIFELLV